MTNIIYGQYDSKKYHLKHYLYSDIPEEIIATIGLINNKNLAIFRGGIAYIYLLEQENYLLKDIDMLARENNKDRIIELLNGADVVFVNNNTFGDVVITAFWKDIKEYYKVDILLCEELPAITTCIFEGSEKKTVPVSYIWRNRIEKIAEKQKRKHTDAKTLNHYRVSCKLSEFLIENPKKLDFEDAFAVKNRLCEVKMELMRLIGDKDLESYINMQEKIIKRCLK